MNADIETLIETRRQNSKKIILEFGPGEAKVDSDAIGIDQFDKCSVDLIADLGQGLPFLKGGSIDEIHAYHFLEHMADLGLMMSEIERVLKPGGKFFGSVPHFSNPYFYSDYTHHSFWGLYTLAYFCKNTDFKRTVPKYCNHLALEVKQVRIIFASPFFIRNKIKKILEYLFNMNQWLMEFYEENLVYLFPCYEIQFEIIKNEGL